MNKPHIARQQKLKRHQPGQSEVEQVRMDQDSRKMSVLVAAIISNLIAMIALCMIMLFGGKAILANAFWSISPCTAPFPLAAGGSILLVLMGDILWHFYSKQSGRTASEAIFNLLKAPAVVLDLMTPSGTPILMVGSAALAVGVTCIIFSLSYKPFEAAPVLAGFSVQKPGSQAQVLQVGGKLNVGKDEKLSLAALLQDSNPVHCEWSTFNKGPADSSGCTFQYHLPLGKVSDILTVHVQSRCKTQSAYGSLNIFVQP